MKIRAVGLLVLLVFFSACRGGRSTPTLSPVVPTTQPPPMATLTFTPPPPPSQTPTQIPPTPAPQKISFQAEDGVTLVGELFLAEGVAGPAPALMLMHQMGSSRAVWVQNGLVNWLTGRPVWGKGPGSLLFAPLPQALTWPALPAGQRFNVFTFDFRGHGESQGRIAETADFLMDAKAAYAVLQQQAGVDPQQIALIGASIGADAAIDICVEGCLGALSLSPGNYLDVPYAELVEELGVDGKPAWCIVSQDDQLPAQTCQGAAGETYRSIIYPGPAHGTALLVPGRQPDIGQLFLDFLKITFGF